jgi:hypothetical protein
MMVEELGGQAALRGSPVAAIKSSYLLMNTS